VSLRNIHTVRWFDSSDFSEEHRLIERLLDLRRQGRIGILLADCGVYYIAENEQDPWGTRRHYSIEQLWALVDQIGPERRPVESETEALPRAKAATA
jgi:hypothetical protein